jgi:preprotein translocase subunit YajC
MPPQTMVMIMKVLPIVFMLVIVYFILLRPQQQQQKKLREMIKNIKRNDEVVTFGGIHGTIVNIKEKTFTLRIDENAKIEIDKSAIAYVAKQRQEE